MASVNDDIPNKPVDSASEYDELDAEDPPALFTIRVLLHSKPIDLSFYTEDATILDLSDSVAEELHIPPANQKFLITPKIGLLKPPFKDPTLQLRTLQEKKIVLMGATATEVEELETALEDRQERVLRRRAAMDKGRKVKANKYVDVNKASDEAKYTFHAIEPLSRYPDPEKSKRYLVRLANDAGIKAAMRKYRLSVAWLGELDPLENTVVEGNKSTRTLGLNTGAGLKIELRLRTDLYDGYRDYKTIRDVLCHELAHNVWMDHSPDFWALTKQLEAEVARNDWRTGGQSVGGEFHNPNDAGVTDEDVDHGGWTGGTFVLGSGNPGKEASSAGQSLSPRSRREMMAAAAEERSREQREAKSKKQGKDGKDVAK
jgi:predicted metal-dependent hydrolase